MKPASLVLLSGGLDSAVSMAMAMEETRVLLALTFTYGQRAAQREREASAHLCHHYGLRQEVVELPFLAALTNTALVNEAAFLPSPTAEELDDPVKGLENAQAVWVPNRNGLFLNAAAAFADSLGGQLLVTGFNAEEGVTFPDNTPEFIAAVNESLAFSTSMGVRAVSYVGGWDKKRILAQAIKMDLPLQNVWSCYKGGQAPCGECESCRRLKRACAENNRPELWNSIGYF